MREGSGSAPPRCPRRPAGGAPGPAARPRPGRPWGRGKHRSIGIEIATVSFGKARLQRLPSAAATGMATELLWIRHNAGNMV